MLNPIDTRKLCSFDKHNEVHKAAYKRIRKFDFVKNQELINKLIPGNRKTVSHEFYDNHYYMLITNFNFETCRQERYLIDLFNCYSMDGSFYQFKWDEAMTTAWRQSMIKYFGREYKASLESYLELQRVKLHKDIEKEIDRQLSEINHLSL